MARLWSSGFELNSSTIEFAGNSHVAASTTHVRSGTYAGKALNNTDSVGYQFSSSVSIEAYMRAYIYIDVTPSGTARILAHTNNGFPVSGYISLTTSNTLQLYQSDSTQIGSDSAVLNTAQWYRIELHTKSGSGTGAIEGRIDGVSFASSSSATISATGAGWINFGIISSVTGTIYFDDIAINDSTGSFQNSWPGDGSIVHLQPNADGDSHGWATAVGGTAGAANNYTRVSEVTPDDVTSYNADVVGGRTDDYDLSATPVAIGSGDTINYVGVGVRYSGASASAVSPFVVRIKKTTGGVVDQSGTITPNATSWSTNANAAPFNYPVVTNNSNYQDPSGNPWTKANLDTTQIGIAINSTGTNAAQISTLWLLVDSTPSAGTTTSTSTSSSTSTSTSTSSTSSSTSSTSTSSTSTSTTQSGTTTSVSTSSSTSTSSTSTSLSTSTSVSTSTSSTSSSTSSTSSSTSTTTIAPGTQRTVTGHRWHRMSPLLRTLGV